MSGNVLENFDRAVAAVRNGLADIPETASARLKITLSISMPSAPREGVLVDTIHARSSSGLSVQMDLSDAKSMVLK